MRFILFYFISPFLLLKWSRSHYHTRPPHCPIRRNASFFFFFRPFSDQCYRDSLYPTPRVLKPTSPPHNPHPRALPLKPCKSCHCHGLHSPACTEGYDSSSS